MKKVKKMTETRSIVLIGVGGQGTVLVSRILTDGLMSAGYDVKMSEIHGMAQRGGSVSTQVRCGKKVHSPIIGPGGADILVAFEEMEALRGSQYLKPDGVAVINRHRILPLPVITGKAEYPEGAIDAMRQSVRTIDFDAAAVATELGNSRVMNVVLLGALVEVLNLTDIDWEKSIRDLVPKRFIDINLKAFEAGKNLARDCNSGETNHG